MIDHSFTHAISTHIPGYPAVSVVSPHMGANGWPFANVDKFADADVDPLYNSEHVRDLYFKADPNYSGRYVGRSALVVVAPRINGPCFFVDSLCPCSGTRRTTQL